MINIIQKPQTQKISPTLIGCLWRNVTGSTFITPPSLEVLHFWPEPYFTCQIDVFLKTGSSVKLNQYTQHIIIFHIIL